VSRCLIRKHTEVRGSVMTPGETPWLDVPELAQQACLGLIASIGACSTWSTPTNIQHRRLPCRDYSRTCLCLDHRDLHSRGSLPIPRIGSTVSSSTYVLDGSMRSHLCCGNTCILTTRLARIPDELWRRLSIDDELMLMDVFKVVVSGLLPVAVMPRFTSTPV
jgi:hypothetical protein